jgi:galactonate dehydratase
MQVTDYQVFEIPPRWQFVKIETSSDLIGWGEPILEGRARTTSEAVSELMDNYVVGSSPFEIEDLWQQMYRSGFYRGGPILMSAIAGIDQALWDIKGQYLDVPVYELLGGKVRDQIRLYGHIPAEDHSPDAYAEGAVELVDRGFTAIKTTPTEAVKRVDNPAIVAKARERLEAIRQAVGTEVDVALDFHGRVTKPMVKRLADVLEPYEPMWIEEPVLPQQNDALPGLASYTSIPIATGERMFSRWDFKQVFEQQSVDIIQPDLSHAGGITEVKKIASMAEAYDIAVAPHSPLGPISLAASVQIDACSPNALIQEQVFHRNGYYSEDIDVRSYLTNPEVLDFGEGGYVELPTGPGLGIDVNEEYIREVQEEDLYEIPTWRHKDGSLAEW